MRKLALLCLGVGAFVAFSGCDSDNFAKKLSDAHDQSEALKADIEKPKDQLDELKEQVDEFDDTNWREVVPEVRTKVSDLQSDGVQLEESVTALTSELDTLQSEANSSDSDDR